MLRSALAVTALAAFAAACAEPANDTTLEEGAEPAAIETEADTAGAMAANGDVQLECTPQDTEDIDDRASPYDSVSFTVGDGEAKICYGRPSSRGRTMIGGENVPFGQLWRTGANEPTIIHLDFPAEIAGMAVEPGSYSLYTVPGEEEWEVIVNRSISQWGHESTYTAEVEAQEVGRSTVAAESPDERVETFTITTEDAGENAENLVLEWEDSRIEIPVVHTGA